MRSFFIFLTIGVIGYFIWWLEFGAFNKDTIFSADEMYQQAMQLWSDGEYHESAQTFLSAFDIYFGQSYRVIIAHIGRSPCAS